VSTVDCNAGPLGPLPSAQQESNQCCCNPIEYDASHENGDLTFAESIPMATLVFRKGHINTLAFIWLLVCWS